jgi:hypothetical protein
MVCAVITPAYLTTEVQLDYAREMIGTLLAQTDASWHLVLVDDASPLHGAAGLYAELRTQLKDKITIIRLAENSGQGICRNIGARWAWRHGLPHCLYLDCDDQADPRRVATVRSVFDEDPDVDFVYSSFDLIDEFSRPVAEQDVSPSIREILDAHSAGAAHGREAWQVIGTVLGYTTLTSVVSVRTWLAVSHPFPDTYVSEDAHAWLRMTAATDGVFFDSSSRGKYRITTDGSGSSARRRIGDNFYQQKAWVDTNGFISAVRLALQRSSISPAEAVPLLRSFYERSAITLSKENEAGIAEEYFSLAERIVNIDSATALRMLPTKPTLFRPIRATNSLRCAMTDSRVSTGRLAELR